MEKNKEKMNKENGMSKIGDLCNDKNCPVHGHLKIRGRIFEGVVTKKLDKRITIEFERMVYVRKYERYKKSKTKVHARLPDCMRDKVNVGERIRIQECRPLSKIIHFVFLEKVGGKNKEKKTK